MEPDDQPRPLSAVMRKAMAERELTFRQLATLTRGVAHHGRGLSHGYLASTAAGNETPRLETIELLAEVLDVKPATIAEYRLALARRQLDPREVGLAAALEALGAFELTRSGEEAAAEGGRRLPVPESLKRRARGETPTPADRAEGRARGAA